MIVILGVGYVTFHWTKQYGTDKNRQEKRNVLIHASTIMCGFRRCSSSVGEDRQIDRSSASLSSSRKRGTNDDRQIVAERDREKEMERTLRHPTPQYSLMGPSTPNASPRNHQKLATMPNAKTPKTIHLVRSLHRREVNTKWSKRCAVINTAKYRVGSCNQEEVRDCI